MHEGIGGFLPLPRRVGRLFQVAETENGYTATAGLRTFCFEGDDAIERACKTMKAFYAGEIEDPAPIPFPVPANFAKDFGEIIKAAGKELGVEPEVFGKLLERFANGPSGEEWKGGCCGAEDPDDE